MTGKARKPQRLLLKNKKITKKPRELWVSALSEKDLAAKRRITGNKLRAGVLL